MNGRYVNATSRVIRQLPHLDRTMKVNGRLYDVLATEISVQEGYWIDSPSHPAPETRIQFLVAACFGDAETTFSVKPGTKITADLISRMLEAQEDSDACPF